MPDSVYFRAVGLLEGYALAERVEQYASNIMAGTFGSDAVPAKVWAFWYSRWGFSLGFVVFSRKRWEVFRKLEEAFSEAFCHSEPF